MKELSIEQKAKAYDEAIEKIQKYVKDEYGCTRLRPEDIFPELKECKESENEKIRKSIIEFVKQNKSFHYLLGVSKEDAVTWLERQGEQKPVEWSEEDERDFDVIYGIIYNSCNAEDASRLIAWLKSLKDRVQPQQQWKPSEEQLIALQDAMNQVGNLTLTGSKLNSLYQYLKKLK